MYDPTITSVPFKVKVKIFIKTHNKRTHCVSKNVPHLICYNFDICECILIFFGRNVTDKVSNQKTLCCATPNNLCFCTACKTGKHKNRMFFSQMLYQYIEETRSDYLNSGSLFDSRRILTLLYDPLILAINAFSSGVLGAWFRIKKVESAAAVGLCCAHNACAPMRCLPDRKKCHLTQCHL